MRVQEVIIEGNKKRYMLLNKEGRPILPVLKYLESLDTVKKATTLKKHIAML
ncbi:transposase [Peribacillus sp. FSL E2-0159]|uniref:transposase n=1 Tax=Peribacillus sp. FSL E2-0159 TaxID=2975289 RepID=UPI003159C462